MNMVAIETFSLDDKLTTVKLKSATLHHCKPLVVKNSGKLKIIPFTCTVQRLNGDRHAEHYLDYRNWVCGQG